LIEVRKYYQKKNTNKRKGGLKCMVREVKTMRKTTIKTFNNFVDLNEFLSSNTCVVRSIDPGVTRIYVEIEEASNATSSQQTTDKKIGNVDTIVDEVVTLKLADSYYGTPDYNKYKGRALVDYLRSYENGETLLAVVIAGLNCNESEATNLRLYFAGEKFDSYYVK
jgi:hypothetical protein